MKNKRAYDNCVYATLGTILIVTILLCANACNRELENAAPKAGEKKLNHATSIYEVEFDGAKYIVVDTHRGIGVCRKAEPYQDSPNTLYKSQGNDSRRFSEKPIDD